jgi:ribonuclease Z
MHLTINCFSTALFSTFYLIDELGLLFDAGDGVSALLGHKSRKARYVFLSHADRDHISGLLQLVQLNGCADAPQVFYPSGSGSFPPLEEFSKAFDPLVQRPTWTPLNAGDEVSVGKDIIVRTIRNDHVPAHPDVTKSLSFCVERLKRKLRPEWSGLSGKDIAALRSERPDNEITQEVRENLLAYSGDTPVADPGRWAGVSTLIHEATFLGDDHDDGDDPRNRRNKHSRLEDVLAMAKQAAPARLVLGHFSSRYSAEQIVAAVERASRALDLRIPVKLVLPGQVARILIRKDGFA